MDFQFNPEFIKGGSARINEGYGRKHYCAWFTQGKFTIIHKSRKQFKRASEAIEYANKVFARYQRLYSFEKTRRELVEILNHGAVKG